MTKGTTSMGKFTKRKRTLDAEDVVITHFISEEKDAQNADIRQPRYGNIIGLNSKLFNYRNFCFLKLISVHTKKSNTY